MIKPSKQSKELAGALDEDQKRRAVDAAKKRAVAQRADYDTFKKLVSVAHLKPLHAPSTRSSVALLPAWQLDPNSLASTTVASGDSNSVAAQQSTSHDSSCSITKSALSAAEAGGGNGAFHVPCNSAEFSREWRRTCTTPAAKYRFLKQCGAASMASIFKVEITGELLGQLLCVLQDQWKQQAQQQHELTQDAAPQQQQQQQHVSKQQEATPQQQQTLEGRRPTAGAASKSDCGCPEQCSSSSSSGDVGGSAALQQEAQYVVQLLHQLTGAGRFDLNARLLGSKAKFAAAQLCDEVAATLKVQQQQQDSNRNSFTAVAHSGADVRTGNVGTASATAAATPASVAPSELIQRLQLGGQSSSGSSTASGAAQQQQYQAALTKLQHVHCRLHLDTGCWKWYYDM